MTMEKPGNIAEKIINLKQFCSKTYSNMKEPFSVGDYTYATDGFIIVRVPLVKKITKTTSLDINALPFDHNQITFWLDMPELPAEKTCINCDGTGKVKTCPECNGKKTIAFENDYNRYEIDCETCNDDIYEEVECEECDGTGKISAIDYIELNDVCFYIKHMKLLKNLPDVKLAIVKCGKKEPMRFKFTGGIGLLVPLRKIQ